MGLGLALARLRPDTVHPGHPLIPEVPRGALDPDWIPAVATRGLIVIGRDKRVRTKPAEKQAIIDSGLRYIWIGGSRTSRAGSGCAGSLATGTRSSG